MFSRPAIGSSSVSTLTPVALGALVTLAVTVGCGPTRYGGGDQPPTSGAPDAADPRGTGGSSRGSTGGSTGGGLGGSSGTGGSSAAGGSRATGGSSATGGSTSARDAMAADSSSAPKDAGTTQPSPDAAPSTGADAAPGTMDPTSRRVVWRSHNISLLATEPQARVVGDGGGPMAVFEFFMSSDPSGAQKGGTLPMFRAAPHPDAWNKADRIWTMGPVTSYPYAGRSAVLRGDDEGEVGAPAPVGVKDLQLHPPDGDTMVVAAFVAPLAGTYSVEDFAARRVSANGTSTLVVLRAPANKMVASLKPGNDLTWVRDTGPRMLGHLEVGDRIYFAVGKDGDVIGDATEVAFSVIREP